MSETKRKFFQWVGLGLFAVLAILAIQLGSALMNGVTLERTVVWVMGGLVALLIIALLIVIRPPGFDRFVWGVLERTKWGRKDGA